MTNIGALWPYGEMLADTLADAWRRGDLVGVRREAERYATMAHGVCMYVEIGTEPREAASTTRDRCWELVAECESMLCSRGPAPLDDRPTDPSPAPGEGGEPEGGAA